MILNKQVGALLSELCLDTVLNLRVLDGNLRHTSKVCRQNSDLFEVSRLDDAPNESSPVVMLRERTFSRRWYCLLVWTRSIRDVIIFLECLNRHPFFGGGRQAPNRSGQMMALAFSAIELLFSCARNYHEPHYLVKLSRIFLGNTAHFRTVQWDGCVTRWETTPSCKGSGVARECRWL